MKTDAEVLLMRRERAKGKTQQQAAARASMGVRTVQRYERRGQLPSFGPKQAGVDFGEGERLGVRDPTRETRVSGSVAPRRWSHGSA